jgi:hypothetical protein
MRICGFGRPRRRPCDVVCGTYARGVRWVPSQAGNCDVILSSPSARLQAGSLAATLPAGQAKKASLVTTRMVVMPPGIADRLLIQTPHPAGGPGLHRGTITGL